MPGVGPENFHFKQVSGDVIPLVQGLHFEKHCLNLIALNTVPVMGFQYLLVVNRLNESMRNEKIITLIYH